MVRKIARHATDNIKLKLKMKNCETGSSKMKRGSFFKYAGSAILGAITFVNTPFKFFQTNTPKAASIKITENPNAVRRTSGVSKNG